LTALRAIASGTLVLAALLATPHVGAQQAAKLNPATIERLGGFGEGVASGMMVPSMLSGKRVWKGPHGGSAVVKTYRHRGGELEVWLGQDGRPHYLSLAIARNGFALPMGLHIGDARGMIEAYLGAPSYATGNLLVYRRTAPDVEGCSDPVTLGFEKGRLVRVEWSWESCMD
jgi:hypothetical protein